MLYFAKIGAAFGTTVYADSPPTGSIDVDVCGDEAIDLALAEFGESIVYLPRGGGSRTIKALVDRIEPGQIDGAVYGVAPKLIVHVKNHGVDGITADEFDGGGDKITVAVRVGESTVDRRILNMTMNDGNYLQLEVQ